ncbi:MAG: hypothetical protein JNL08_12100 [Planctomycetes bacterium]|nr:hypothetical protein [Planctomycetota bacterium]
MLTLLGLLLVGAALLALAHAAGRRRLAVARGLAAALLLLLGGRVVLAARADWEWALLPWPGYAFVQGFTLYALAAAFFGAAAAALPVRWNRRVVLAVGAAVLAHGLHRHRWLAWPEVHGDARRAGADHHLRQSTHYTCGPVACVAALSHCGVAVDERTMAAACLTRRSGSSLFDLYRGCVEQLRDRPFDVSIRWLTAEQIVAQDQVLVGSNRGGGHALCIAVTAGAVVVHDPLAATARPGSPAFLRDEFRGPAVVVRRRAAGPVPAR